MRSRRITRRGQTGAAPPRGRARRPSLEEVEGRILLSSGGLAQVRPSGEAVVALAGTAHDRVFEGAITKGPEAHKFTLDGPIVLGTSGRIQFAGELIQAGGPPIPVIGTQTGGGVAMTFFVPAKGTTVRILAFGAGQLTSVPGGQTLVGSGNLEGPDLKRDSGHWQTVAPAKAGGS